MTTNNFVALLQINDANVEISVFKEDLSLSRASTTACSHNNRFRALLGINLKSELLCKTICALMLLRRLPSLFLDRNLVLAEDISSRSLVFFRGMPRNVDSLDKDEVLSSVYLRAMPRKVVILVNDEILSLVYLRLLRSVVLLPET